MFRFDPVAEKLSLYRTPNFMAYQCIMDSTGSFWFACIRNNIFRLVTSQIPFLTLKVNNSAQTAQTNRGSILEDSLNKIWILCNYGTYISSDFNVTSSIVLEHYRFPDGDTTKQSGFVDRKGNIWFGSLTGKLTRYNPISHEFRTFVIHNPRSPESHFQVPLTRQDKSGNIWVATSRAGLYKLSGGTGGPEHILDFNEEPGDQSRKMLLDFLIDSRGQFWILTAESLVSIIMPGKKIIDYTDYGNGIFTAFRSNIRVKEDNKGKIWILNSRSGLYLFDRQNDSFNKVHVVAEDAGTEYYDLLADRNDRLWIAHNKGISVYNQEDGKSRIILTPKLQYDIQSCQIKSGEILYLNDNQLFIFYENIPLNNYLPPVYLTRLLVNGTDYNKIFAAESDISSLKRLDLPFRFNTLSIEFAALNYLNPEHNLYRYFMTKSDKDTMMVSQGLPAEYKNMPPGKYKFWVTGSNNDGLWNPSGVTLDIRIHPPWYRSVVAYVIYFIAFISLMGTYIRLRISRLTRDKLKLKAEIEAATGELEVKNRQLAEIDRIKTHFFADISHEIRTPLSLILGPLENISKEEMLSSRMSAIIDLMKRNAQRLMHLVNQLLDISRLDAGKMKITLAEDDIVKCLRILVYEFLSQAESKHIKYIADLPEGKFTIMFDRDKVEKIISNILSNAFKYTPETGVVQCMIRIETDINNNSQPVLLVKIMDSGPGISKEHQDRIFDRFYRVEGHQETDVYGTGIGLSLVNEFVSLLHGEITLKSSPGTGSVFNVTIPLGKDHLSSDEYVIIKPSLDVAVKQEMHLWKEKSRSAIIKNGETGRIKILIIEDNEDLRNYIREILSKDYLVLEAENGKAGINTAFTMMPDIILTDIMMPDTDGITLCTQLKNDERTSHIPIIMVTAKATTEDKIEGLRSGADDYLVKPFNMAELTTRISNLLSIRDKLKLKYSELNYFRIGNQVPESVDDRFIHRVIQIINSNFKDHSFDVHMLEERLGMSRMHITRKLKILTGYTPGIFIRNIRLEKAAELMSAKAGNLTEISNSVGIANPSSFTKIVQEIFRDFAESNTQRIRDIYWNSSKLLNHGVTRS